MKKLIAALLIAAPVFAESTSEVNDPKPQHFVNGIYVGPNTSNGVSQGDGTVSATTPLRVFGSSNLGAPGATTTFDGGVTFNGSVTFPATAATGTVSYYAGGTEEGLVQIGNLVLTNAVKLGGYGLPGTNSVGTARAFTLVAVTGMVTSASGGGAANSVITATDGTNTCTFTIPCNVAPPAGSSATGGIRIAGVNGSGTGCVYPAGANITASVTTGGCTTTQPTFSGSLSGTWQ